MKVVERHANPLKSETSWQVILVEGLIALGIGLYALLAADSARRNIVLLVGLFLLLNGLVHAYGLLTQPTTGDPMARFRLLRAGIGVVTGLLVVVNRFAEFMSLNAARFVLAIGLLGIGLVWLVGLIVVREDVERRLSGLVVAALLVIWGAFVLYLASMDTSSSRLIGWGALIVGAGLILFAVYRRSRAAAALARS